MIRIFSGFSSIGGSTVCNINLCNALNKAGYETTFYGTDDYPKNKCNYQQIKDKRIFHNPNDILIIHFMDAFQNRPNVKKIVYTCHEQELYPLSKINYKIFDSIRYVSEHQRLFHNVNHPYFVIPDIINETEFGKTRRYVADDNWKEVKHKEKIGGIIGSIDKNKNTHVAIENALKDGCKQVLIFGKISEKDYYDTYVEPLIDNVKVKYMGVFDDKRLMYSLLTDVYQDSISESFGLVKIECMLSSVFYHGNTATSEATYLESSLLIGLWLKRLGLTE